MEMSLFRTISFILLPFENFPSVFGCVCVFLIARSHSKPYKLMSQHQSKKVYFWMLSSMNSVVLTLFILVVTSNVFLFAYRQAGHFVEETFVRYYKHIQYGMSQSVDYQ